MSLSHKDKALLKSYRRRRNNLKIELKDTKVLIDELVARCKHENTKVLEQARVYDGWPKHCLDCNMYLNRSMGVIIPLWEIEEDSTS